MRGFHTAALVALVALALCAGGAADNNTPLTRGASNIDIAPARPSLNITATARPRAQEAQGSGADEFMRKQRPDKGGNNQHGKPHDKGVCYKKSNGSPCIPTSVSTCKGPLGECMHQVCIPLNTDSGCPCGDKCVNTVRKNKKACLNPLQPCKCASGTCAPNFLPEDTTCIRPQEVLGPCKVRKCKDNGVCAKKNADTGTPCFTDDSITCENAGSCESGTCTLLDCTSPAPSPAPW